MLFTLKNICLRHVARMIFFVWNFSRRISVEEINDLKMQTKDYFHFPLNISKAIMDYMYLKWGNFSIGHAIWLLESGSPVLNLWFWRDNLNMQELSLLTSTAAKNSLQELIIPRPVQNILAISSFKNLKTLNLANNTVNTRKEITTLLSQSQNLVNLNFEGCRQITNKLFKSLIKSKSIKKNLRSLHMRNTSSSPSMAIKILNQLPLLESFTFHDIFGFLHLRVNKTNNIGLSIQHLSLGYFNSTYSNSQSKKMAPVLKDLDFNALKQLELILPHNCELQTLKSICTNCAYLDSFSLWFTSQYENSTESSLMPKRNFSDVVQSVFVGETFPISQLKLISVEHIELNFLFLKMPNLAKLCLENCNICSERERRVAKSLTSLNVNNLRIFDVREILLRSPYLEELEFAHIPMKSTLFSGISLKCLKKFSLYQCMGPPLDSVKVIMMYFPKLLN